MTEALKHSAMRDSAAQIPEAKMPLIPDYGEIRPLGHGGFGTVYLVTDVTGHPFALKVVTSSDEVGDNYRYEREYASICTYRPISDRHPNLLKIPHIGKGEGFFYYTMPLADNLSGGPFDAGTYRQKTLEQVICACGRAMPIRDAIQAVLPVLDALEFLHENGTVHRDVKPENILFMNGKAVLGDIGLITEPKPDMTRVFSQGYSPPGGVTDWTGDLYSVGKVLFAAIGGDVTRPGIPVPTVQSKEPSELFPALNEVLCKAHSLKYKSAAGMKKDLEEILRKTSNHGTAPNESHKPAEIPAAPKETAPAKSPSVNSAQRIRDLMHSKEYLLARVSPVWSLQREPDAFSWKNCCGHLYKMSAPYGFFTGKNELNDQELAKIRVAIFLPSNYGPTTPMVYALANTRDDFSESAYMLPTILDCGYGMIALDTPFTGICKVGSDIIEGKNIKIGGSFEDALRDAALWCGAKNTTYRFAYEARRFTARNLWLAQDFLRTKFGISPRKTILTGNRFGVWTAGFAFNATGFGDVLLCFHCVPRNQSSPSDFDTTKVASTYVGLIWHFIKRLSSFSMADIGFMGDADPSKYAEAVTPPREIHILMGNETYCAQLDVEYALNAYKQLRGSSYHHILLKEDDQAAWPSELARMLNNGKSAVWFDGGHDLAGWRSDLWLKFLETKLRMLNGGI